MAMSDVLSTLIDMKYKKSLMDKAKDERIPLSQKIRGTTEPEFREDFEIPYGPMTRPQNTALDLVSAQASGVPASLQGFNASEYKDITQGNENLRPKTPAVTPEEWDRRFSKREDAAISRMDKSNENFLNRMEAGDKIKLKNRAMLTKFKINSDTRVKEINENIINGQTLENMMTAVKGGNTVAAQSLGAQIAKTLEGGGRLTDQDVTRYNRSAIPARRLMDITNAWVKGVPTDATMDEIQGMVQVLTGKRQELLAPIYNNYIETFAYNEGLAPDEASRMLGLPLSNTMPTPAPSGGNTGSSGLTPEQRKARIAELKSLQGKP